MTGQAFDAKNKLDYDRNTELLAQGLMQIASDPKLKPTMAELIEKVVADLQSAQATLAAAVPGLDRTAIRSASHILISVAGAIGAVRLQASACALNALAHGEPSERIADELRRCIDEIDAAVAFAGNRQEKRR